MTNLRAFGHSLLRREDPRLLRGAGRFTADQRSSGEAQGVVVRSPHAHAILRAIRKEPAASRPGVLAVLTGADAEAEGFGHFPSADSLRNADGSRPITQTQGMYWPASGSATSASPWLSWWRRPGPRPWTPPS